MRYRPAPSVVAVRTFSISAGLAASTVTPGRTAPELSVTTPLRVTWANAADWPTARHATTSPILTNKRILTTSLLSTGRAGGRVGAHHRARIPYSNAAFVQASNHP